MTVDQNGSAQGARSRNDQGKDHGRPQGHGNEPGESPATFDGDEGGDVKQMSEQEDHQPAQKAPLDHSIGKRRQSETERGPKASCFRGRAKHEQAQDGDRRHLEHKRERPEGILGGQEDEPGRNRDEVEEVRGSYFRSAEAVRLGRTVKSSL